ncbi:alpha-1,3-arabinosyltransferase XAT3-like [Tripterygium wilfordii]|nr:alpha-1,3-arabinosyltransferase XAT3-like [Tripterygium wilfordii]
MKQSLLPPPQHLQSSQARRTITCDRSHREYDLCSINGPTVLDPKSSTFYPESPTNSAQHHIVEKVRPYPRKWENFTLSKIKEVTLTSGPKSPPCQVRHNAPALVFSAGGYTGNFFHDFNDGFIPLYITVNSLFADQDDVVLVISKARDWWVRKYTDLLQTFSKHPIIDLDKDNSTHCFTSANVGLISHGFMTINPTLLPNSNTFKHFRFFLDKAYGHGQKSQNHHQNHGLNPRKSLPRLALASRNGATGRVILNQDQVQQLAKEVGFDVIVFEPKGTTSLREAYGLINTSHALVGVHGAALTHSLFLRPGAVFVQVVPLGGEWVAENCFGTSARAMGLEYMEYKIGVEESSLIDKYNRSDALIKDSVALQKKGWSNGIMEIYLKEQNVKLDLVRFREYLERAYKKAKRFMNNEG